MLKSALLLLALAAPAQAEPVFVKEAGVRLSSAVLSGAVNIPPDPNTPLQIVNSVTRFYYIRGSTAVYSAVTNGGGQSFVDDAGVRLSTMTPPVLAISSITGLSILPLNPVPGGGYRMVYTAVSTSAAGDVYNVFSATSADGLAWANDAGARISGGGNFLGSPSLIKLGTEPTTQWRLYYIQNSGAKTPANYRIFSALSSDQGQNFAAASQLANLNGQVGEVAAVKRTDNSIRLFYTAPLTSQTTNSTLLSALTVSGDVNGIVFAQESVSPPRLSTDPAAGFLSNPYVVRSTDTWRWKLYYNYTPFAAAVSTADVFSASEYAPAPASMTPNSVLRTASALTFTVAGDGFSGGASGGTTPTLQLSQGGVTVNPVGSVTRNSDQSLSADFNMNSQALGFWDLTVTNDNGSAGILTNALKIDFAPGTVRLTDNLLRPRNGRPTTIDVMTFNGGQLTAKLYTTTGGFVKTLWDSYAPAGTTTLSWDGTTAAGHTVASGVYLLRTVGQKIDSSEKIVVIK